MAKKQGKSLASIVQQRMIDPKEIDKAASKLHKEEKKQPQEKEKNIRVSVDTPESLYYEMKKAGREEGINSLRHFYLHCAREYLKNRG